MFRESEEKYYNIERVNVQYAPDRDEVKEVWSNRQRQQRSDPEVPPLIAVFSLLCQDYVIYQAQDVAAVEGEQYAEQNPLLKLVRVHVISHGFDLLKLAKYG